MVALAQRIEVRSRIYGISYVLVGLVGVGLVSMGDLRWGETWPWLSIVLWIVTSGILHGAILPAERAVAAGDADAMQRIDRSGPVLSVLFLVVIFLMTVEPGSFLTA